MFQLQVKNLNDFSEQVKKSLNSSITPIIQGDTNKAHTLVMNKTPVATGLLKQKMRLRLANSIISNKVSQKIFVETPGKYSQVLSNMQFGHKEITIVSDKEGLWDWVIAKGLTNRFQPSSLMRIGYNPKSPFYQGGKNPIEIGYKSLKNELERDLKIKFK